MNPDLCRSLAEISSELLAQIRSFGLESVLDRSQTSNYRGFVRIRVAERLLTRWRLKAHMLDMRKNAVAEIITVTPGSITEIHYHENPHAVITILGESERLPEPRGAFYYFKGRTPIPATSGVTLEICPKTLHGFDSPAGAESVAFLSVQSEPIDEDFHVVQKV